MSDELDGPLPGGEPEWARDDTTELWRGAADDGADLHPWLLSATDLLIAWSPDEVSGAPPQKRGDAWDRYFERAGATGEIVEPDEPAPQAETWDAEAADLAVDCLFRFLHAIERCDIATTMECVAPDYHALEHDVEITRDGLRLRLEASLEGWRGESFRVTLTEIPDPLFHPSGILMKLVVQVDFFSTPHARPLTELLPRVVWFRPQQDGRWLIAGMAATA